MLTLRALVAATDFSPPAELAADRAAQLAQAAGASLCLVHSLGAGALADLRRWLGTDGPAEALQAQALEQLQAQAEALQRRHGAVVAVHLGDGDVVDDLGTAAAARGADLLVTGTRGAGLMNGALLGSTAERVARQAARPVLLVRQGAPGPYRRVLLALDFSPCATTALAAAATVAPGAEPVLLHVPERPLEGPLRLAGAAPQTLARYAEAARTEARQRLQVLATAAGRPADRTRLLLPDGGDAWRRVLEAQRTLDADLVVVGQQGRRALGSLLLGRTARLVVAECACDVLIVPPPAG